MHTPPDEDPVAGLRQAVEGIAGALRELDRRCHEAAVLLDRLEARRGEPREAGPLPGSGTSGAGATSVTEPRETEPRPESGALEQRRAALLVGLTLRGGTMDADAFSALAADLGLGHGEVETLFAGADPPLVRRGGRNQVTERGIESAAEWRLRLSPGLLRAATDL